MNFPLSLKKESFPIVLVRETDILVWQLASLLNWEANIPLITQANSESKQEQIRTLMTADGNTILHLIFSAL